MSEDDAAERIAAGEAWEERGEKGWRRVVPSPQPLEILDRATIEALIDDGAIVVAAGGGGIPMVREDGALRGVEAVLDKDLTAALLARTVGADVLLIATDVEAAAIGFGTDRQEWLGEVEPDRLRALLDAGEFAGGSMGPKVRGGAAVRRAPAAASVITSLERLREGVEGIGGDARMSERVIVRRGAYYDSVTLMLVSRAAGARRARGRRGRHGDAAQPRAAARPGLRASTTPGPNDLVIAVRARDDEAIEAAVAAVERELAAKGGAVGRGRARRGALDRRRRAARRRAQPRLPLDPRRARRLRGGGRARGRAARVLLLRRREPGGTRSRSKRRAAERELLFMGADCGTAIIDGVALGFANAVRRGPVGIVGASGHRHPGGELPARRGRASASRTRSASAGATCSAEVGGLMMRAGLELLAGDEDTRAIVAISKPPDPAVAAAIEEAAAGAGKPVVLGFGIDARGGGARGGGARGRRAAGAGRRGSRRPPAPRRGRAGSTAAARCAREAAADRRRAASSPTSATTSTPRAARTR